MSIRPGALPSRVAPSGRIPVPESRIRRLPSSTRTSTHEVLPPIRTVSGPGAASEPREPQNRACTSAHPRPIPEDGQPALELLAACEERHCNHLEIVRASVHGLDPEVAVGRDPAPERLRERQLLQRDRPAILVDGLERLCQLGRAHLRLGVRSSQDLLRRFVEEDEIALSVDQEDRRGDVRREVSGEDQGDRTLLPRRIRHARTVHRTGGHGSPRRYPRTRRRLGSWWAPRSSKPFEGAASSLAGSVPVRPRVERTGSDRGAELAPDPSAYARTAALEWRERSSIRTPHPLSMLPAASLQLAVRVLDPFPPHHGSLEPGRRGCRCRALT